MPVKAKLAALALVAFALCAQTPDDGTGFDALVFWQSSDNSAFAQVQLESTPSFGPCLTVYLNPRPSFLALEVPLAKSINQPVIETFSVYAAVVVPGVPAPAPKGYWLTPIVWTPAGLPPGIWASGEYCFPPGTTLSQVYVSMIPGGSKYVTVAQ